MSEREGKIWTERRRKKGKMKRKENMKERAARECEGMGRQERKGDKKKGLND